MLLIAVTNVLLPS